MADHQTKKQRWQRGAVVRISLNDGHHTYAQMLADPEYAFFDLYAESEIPLEQVVAVPVLFRLWVMRYAHSQGRWLKIGSAPIAAVLKESIQRFNQDPITGKIRLTYDGCDGPEATIDDCEGVECAAVWDPEHVEDRIRDHDRGVSNKWAESLRPKEPPNRSMQADGPPGRRRPL